MGELRREDLKMQKFVLLSDRPIAPYQEALTELLEEISGYRVRGMAVVLLVDPEEEDGDDVLAFYHRMSIRDKQLAAAVIEGDVHYAIAQDAIAAYMGDTEEQEES